MLRGAGVVPTTFDLSELTEANVNVMLTAGMEVLRMIRDDDGQTDNGLARQLYGELFGTDSTGD